MSKQGPMYGEYLRALRSGEYKQCYHSLYVGGKYCCMGVGCRLSGSWPSRWGDESGGGFWTISTRRAIILRPSDTEISNLAERLGVKDGYFLLTLEDVLSEANDDLCHDFPTIADAIEAVWGKPEDEIVEAIASGA